MQGAGGWGAAGVQHTATHELKLGSRPLWRSRNSAHGSWSPDRGRDWPRPHITSRVAISFGSITRPASPCPVEKWALGATCVLGGPATPPSAPSRPSAPLPHSQSRRCLLLAQHEGLRAQDRPPPHPGPRMSTSALRPRSQGSTPSSALQLSGRQGCWGVPRKPSSPAPEV